MKIILVISRIFQREFLLTIRNLADWFNPLFFFIVVSSLFPLAVSPSDMVLKIMGPGVIWVAVLLANLLSLNKLFSEDYRDGSLEQLMLNPYPISLLLFTKIFTHWLIFCVPLILVSPILALMYHLSTYAAWILFITLLLGTPLLSYLGAIFAALTVGLRNNGLLLALLLLPLYVPALIFGSAAVNSAEVHFPFTGQLALLGGLLALALCVSPWTTGVALRIGLAFD